MIRAVWQSFWGDLNTPSTYYDDPQGAAGNFAGHVVIGIVASATISLIYCWASGEMPFRWPVWAGITFAYLVGVEWLQQGWSKADSFVDGGVVSLGAALPLASLYEVTFSPRICLEPRPVEGLAMVILTGVAFLAYVLPRQVRYMRKKAG